MTQNRTHASSTPSLTLRYAQPDDCYRYWLWVNDADVRRASFRTAPISWEEHEQWFNAKLKDADCLLFMGFDLAGECVGQIRFDTLARGSMEIDLSVDTRHRGRGYGIALLRAGLAALKDRPEARTIEARVKVDNLASIETFRAAGFIEIAPDLEGSVRLVLGKLR